VIVGELLIGVDVVGDVVVVVMIVVVIVLMLQCRGYCYYSHYHCCLW
jgi:hypothetical protein